MLIALVAGIGGLLVGTTGAVAWTAGFRHGLRNAQAIARTLTSDFEKIVR